MRLLLFDSSSMFPANPLFAETLPAVGEECGFEHQWIDENEFVFSKRAIYVEKVFFRLSGRRPLGYWTLNRNFREIAEAYNPAVILITCGKYLSPSTIRSVKERTGAVFVNYATDDPFNMAVNTSMFRRGIPYYDIYACTKRAIMDDVRKAGSPNTIYLPFAYKSGVHFPEGPQDLDEQRRFSSDVAFIGQCDHDRLPYITAILTAFPDLRLHLYGGSWGRYAPLRKHYRGFAIGREFRLAVGGAKIVFNLVRRANRDDHVMRTFEIPACGGFMLADRTDGQRAFLTEDKEAVYFSSTEEMVDKIRYYLGHDSQRRRIAEAGYRRITSDKNTYADRLKAIIDIARGGSSLRELSAG